MTTAVQTELLDADGDQLEIAIPDAARNPEILTVPHELIEPDPEQPREQADAELRASMAKEGQLQALIVRPHPDKIGHFMLVDGERRWRSAAGVLHAMRCELRSDLSANRSARLAVQLIANTAKGLTPLEEARAYQRMLAENPEWAVSDLAKHIGKPRSTVAQRLEAMELGAWLEDVATGVISWTMLVETLLPYRGCPDKVHAKARERTRTALALRDGENPTFGPRNFESAVRAAYKPALYPLNKSKASFGAGADRPLFNTKHHDSECNCGGMLIVDYSGASPRKYCGNPQWWGPLHRKAMKEQPKTSSSSAGESRQRATRKELRLPKGSTEVTGSVHEAPPDGCAWVTLVDGKGWSIVDDAPAFDPVVLQKLVKADDLVLVRGTDGVRVATTNAGAMKKAVAAFAKDVDARQSASLKPLRASLKKHGSFSGISGLGVQSLLAAFVTLGENRELEELLRVLCVIEEISPPDSTAKLSYYDAQEVVETWARNLSAKDAKAILTDLAALGADDTIDADQLVRASGGFERKARGDAVNRKVPWLKDVTDKAGAKTPDATRTSQKNASTAHACIYCGCTDEDACDGGCSWVSQNPLVCSTPSCVASHKSNGFDVASSGDSLWDAAEGEDADD